MKRFRIILLVGIGLGALLILAQLLETQFVLGGISLEIYLGLIGALFLGLGWWLGRGRGPNVPQAGSAAPFAPVSPEDSPLSEREHEVLIEISKGLSNQEIADRLHVSLNTVKSHTKNIYLKLEVKRRTQAVSRAKELGLLP